MFSKNKVNNEFTDSLIKEKTRNVRLLDQKLKISSRVNSILQNQYEEISILKKEKRRLFRAGEKEVANLSIHSTFNY